MAFIVFINDKNNNDINKQKKESTSAAAPVPMTCTRNRDSWLIVFHINFHIGKKEMAIDGIVLAFYAEF